MQKKTNEKKMPFIEHLEELRWVLIKCIITIVVLGIGCYFVSDYIQRFLTRPYPYPLVYLAVAGAFIIKLKISITTGAVLGLPFIAFQFWSFIAPGLLERERKHIPVIVILTTVCFILGASFAYFVIIPFGLRFLSSFQSADVVQNVTIEKYLSFVIMLMLVFGLIFELPLLSAFLTRIGILNYRFLRKVRKYGIVVIFIGAAMLTPPDPTTQLFLAGPLILLYEISIFVSKVVGRKKQEKEEQEEKEEEEERKKEREQAKRKKEEQKKKSGSQKKDEKKDEPKGKPDEEPGEAEDK